MVVLVVSQACEHQSVQSSRARVLLSVAGLDSSAATLIRLEELGNSIFLAVLVSRAHDEWIRCVSDRVGSVELAIVHDRTSISIRLREVVGMHTLGIKYFKVVAVHQ